MQEIKFKPQQFSDLTISIGNLFTLCNLTNFENPAKVTRQGSKHY